MIKLILQAIQNINDTFDKSLAFTYVVQALAETQQFELAAIITGKIEDSYKKIEALSILAEEYSKANFQDKALAILEQALQLRQSRLKNPDNRLSERKLNQLIISRIIKSYIVIGEYRSSMQVAQNCFYGIDEPSSSLINDEWFLDSTRLLKLLKLVETEKNQQLTDILQPTNDELTLTQQAENLAEVAHECAKYQQFEVAKQALQVVESIGLPKTLITGLLVKPLSMLAVKYAEVGQYNLALKNLERIDDISWKSSALKKIAGKLAEDGQYEQAIELIQKIKQPREKNEALEQLAKQYAAAGLCDKALQIAKSIPDKNYRDLAILKTIKQCVGFGKSEQAFQIARRIRRENFRLDVLTAIAEGSATIEEPAQISEIMFQLLRLSANIINVNGEKSSILIKVVEQYIRVGQTDKAFEILSQALSETETIASLDWKALILTEIAIKYVELRQKTKGLALLSKAIQIVENNQAKLNKANILDLIAMALTKSGLCEQALKIINSIDINNSFTNKQESAIRKCSALLAIARKYADFNKKNKTVEILSKTLQILYLIDEKTRANYIGSIAKIYFSLELPKKINTL